MTNQSDETSQPRLPMGWAGGSTVPDARGATRPPGTSASSSLQVGATPRRSPLLGLALGLLGGGVVVAGLWFAFAQTVPTEGTPVVKAPSAVADPPRSPAPAPAPTTGPIAPRCPDGMAFIQGGKFYMGTDSDDPVLATARPAHAAEVGSFCLDLREVTVDDYRSCSSVGECKRAFRNSEWPQGSTHEQEWRDSMAAHSPLCNENAEDRGAHPVNCVDWGQADHYCKRRGGALPTEAQWEFAARGSDGRVYSWGDAKPTEKHMNGCGRECVDWRAQVGLPPNDALYAANDGWPGTAPAGNFPEGMAAHGLLDMAGNVFEWTADEYRGYAGDDAEAGAATSRRRVIRGGAFNSFQPQFADPALRFPQDEGAHTHGIGFRCAAAPLR